MYKENQQKCTASGDIPRAISIGEETLSFAKNLSGPGVNYELGQIHYNLSHLNLTINKIEEAEKHGKLALTCSERDIATNPNSPQSQDLMSVILLGDSYRNIQLGRIEDADRASTRALEITEKLHKPDHPQIVKALRGLAMVRERQGRMEEAVSHMKRGYELTKSNPPQSQIVQMVIEEYVQLLLKMGTVNVAIQVATDNFNQVQEAVKQTNEKNPFVADVHARLSFVLRRVGRLPEAEQLCAEALKIRQAIFGPESHQAAVTMLSYANLCEVQGKVGPETEAMLNKCLTIFRKVEGPDSSNVKTTIAAISSLRIQRKSLGGNDNNDDNDADDDGLIVTDHVIPASLSEKAKVLMDRSNVFFAERKFKAAEPLLLEAFRIFSLEYGPNHQNTKAAKQNLDVIRNNIILELWHEVVREEKIKIDEQRQPGSDFTQGWNGTDGDDLESVLRGFKVSDS